MGTALRPQRILLFLALSAFAQDNLSRLHQHKVTAKESPAPEPGAENELIPSLVEGLHSPQDWNHQEAAGADEAVDRKFSASSSRMRHDRRWFGDIRKAVIRDRREIGTTIRVWKSICPSRRISISIICCCCRRTRGAARFRRSSAGRPVRPDYAAPEQWWGQWLAEHGYVVLTSWSFIRHYRDDTNYASGAAEKVYERFGHWLGLGKMVYDARREAEYLRSLKQVDPQRLGFIGFSLGAKAAVYVAAFAPEFKATVALDPHIAVNGSTNWYDRWYLDWLRPFPGYSDTAAHSSEPAESRSGAPRLRARSSRIDGAHRAAGVPADRRQPVGRPRRRFRRSRELGLRQPRARSLPAAWRAGAHPVRFDQ